MMPLDWARQVFSLIALGYFALGMMEWAGIPGLALLTGTLPFLYKASTLTPEA